MVMAQYDNATAQRGRQSTQWCKAFKICLSGGLVSPALRKSMRSKFQKKEDGCVKANIQGRGFDALPVHGGRADWSPIGVDTGVQMRVEVGPYATYVDVSLGLNRQWTLNKLAVLLPTVFLDERSMRYPPRAGPHQQLCKAEGGAGGSYVVWD